MKLKWEMTKGIVKCERCGFISKDGVCYNCHAGYFRFYINEVKPMSITTEGE